jgi:hypothetical protein
MSFEKRNHLLRTLLIESKSESKQIQLGTLRYQFRYKSKEHDTKPKTSVFVLFLYFLFDSIRFDSI